LAPNRGASEALVSPDGTRLITIEPKAFDAKGAKFVPHAGVFRDLAAGGPPVEFDDGFPMAAFAPDGKTFALATSDRGNGPGRLRLCDAGTGREAAILADEPNSNVFFPAFSPDGKRVAAEFRDLGETTSVVRVWDTASGKESPVLKPAGPSLTFWPTF